MLAHALLLPVIQEAPPPGKRLLQHPPPQKRGMTRAQWLQHVANGGDERFEAMEGFEEEDKNLPPSSVESEDESAGAKDLADTKGGERDDAADSSDEPIEPEDEVSNAEETRIVHDSQSGEESEEESTDEGDEPRAARIWKEGHGPLVTGAKRKAQQSSSDEGGIDESFVEEYWGGIGTQTPEESDATRLRRMAASQLPNRQGQKWVQFEIPSRREGKMDNRLYIILTQS